MVKNLKSKNTEIQKEQDSIRNEHETQDPSMDYDLEWIDEFVRKIRPYIYVRELDRLLILIPNQVYKLNQTGAAMLGFVLKGHSINEFLGIVGDDVEKRKDIHFFFCDLRAAVSGCLRENEQREAIAYYEFDGRFNEYPVLSEIAVTYNCNLNCEFCYVGIRSHNELKTSDTKKILFKIYHEAQVPSVSFTGGEPLLRTDICELIEYASSIGLWTNLITNGTLLNESVVNGLKKSGLSSAQVSIEGHNPELHDGITNKKGSFNATITGITSLVKAGIPVHTNTTVSRNNIKHLEDIVLLAKHIGLKRISMNLLIPCGAASDRKDLWVSYSEIGDCLLQLKRRAEEECIKFLWYSPVPLCRFNPIAHGFGNKSCAAITGLLSIDPMGNVIPCSSWRMPVGSLLDKRFKDIWESSMTSYFKNIEYVPEGCHTCVDLDACKGACPLYWRAFGNEELHGRS